MSDSAQVIPDATATSQANLPTRYNENADALSIIALWGRRASACTGLTWGYYGGRYRSTSIANGTLALTGSTTNYVVADRSTGALSVSTSITNWNNQAAFQRCYLIVTSAGAVTSWEDHRMPTLWFDLSSPPPIGNVTPNTGAFAGSFVLTGNTAINSIPIGSNGAQTPSSGSGFFYNTAALALNDRRWYVFRDSGGLIFGFHNDATTLAATAYNITGGFATGITGHFFNTSSAAGSAATQFAVGHTTSAVNYVAAFGGAASLPGVLAPSGADPTQGIKMDFGSSASATQLILSCTGASGINLGFRGNGATTPNKSLRIINGSAQWVNNAYSQVIQQLNDDGTLFAAGALDLTGSINAAASANRGQIVFPATQNPSSNVNTLDDYEEGTWTPGITFATPGNLSVAYTVQGGFYTKVGRKVTVFFNIVTSSFTHSTASGALFVSGLPFVADATASFDTANCGQFSGFTHAGMTQMNADCSAGANALTFAGSGSAIANFFVGTGDMPTGGTVILRGQLQYLAAN